MTVRVRLHDHTLRVETDDPDDRAAMNAAVVAHLKASLSEGMCLFGHRLTPSHLLGPPLGECGRTDSHVAEGYCMDCRPPAVHAVHEDGIQCWSRMFDPHADGTFARLYL